MANSRTKKAKVTQTEKTKTDTRLQGRGLFIARIIWIVIALFDLGTLVIGVPAMAMQVRMPCLDPTLASCNNYQLVPAQIAAAQFLHISLDTFAVYTVTCDVLITLLFLITGALIFWHKSNDRMGLFVSIFLITFGCLGVDLVHESALSGFSSTPGLASLVYNAISIFGFPMSVLIWPALGVFFCTFPDGRFVPRWSWILPGLFVIQFGFYILPAPWNLQSWPQSLQILEELLIYGSTISTQIYRYFFVASPVQRQQIKWLTLGFGLVVLIVLPAPEYLQVLELNDPHSLIQLSNPLVTMVSYLPIPLSIGIGLLRYRLWDIDHVINRTLVYGSLTVLLALLYFGLIVALQSLFQGMFNQNNAVTIVISTLVIAAIFQPLRRRIQAIIDRRFYRRKYDAAKIVTAFSSTLRQEVDLDTLREHLIAVVQETMQPSHVSLWLRKPEQDKTSTAWEAKHLSHEPMMPSINQQQDSIP